MPTIVENQALIQRYLADPKLQTYLRLEDSELADFLTTLSEAEVTQIYQIVARLALVLAELQTTIGRSSSQEFLTNISDDEAYALAQAQGILFYWDDLERYIQRLKGNIVGILNRTSLKGTKILYEHEGQKFFHPVFWQILMQSENKSDFCQAVHREFEIGMRQFGESMYEELKTAAIILSHQMNLDTGYDQD